MTENQSHGEVAAAGTGKTRSRAGGQAGVVVLLVVGSLLVALSVPAIWVNRTLVNTDNWVATVTPLAEEPAIQDAVAATVSDAVLKAVDVPGLVAKYLPQQAQPLLAPISDAVEDFVRKQTTDFTRSPEFRAAWVQANRTGHGALLAAITQRDGTMLSNRAGVVSLRLGPIADAIKARLVAGGLSAAASLPTGSINKEIVLFESPMLAKAGAYIDLLQRVAFWLPVLALLAFAGVISLSEDRRRGVLLVGAGTLVATVLPLQGLYLAKIPVIGAAQKLGTQNSAAASIAYDTIFRNLFSAERLLAFLALVVVVGAVLAGPAALAVALRRGLKGGLSAISMRFDFGRFGAFVAANKSSLRTAGLVVAVLAAVIPGQRATSVGSITWTVVALLAWVALIEFFGSERVT